VLEKSATESAITLALTVVGLIAKGKIITHNLSAKLNLLACLLACLLA